MKSFLPSPCVCGCVFSSFYVETVVGMERVLYKRGTTARDHNSCIEEANKSRYEKLLAGHVLYGLEKFFFFFTSARVLSLPLFH